ncbi:hypothetical protein [Streptomyces sp. NPDC006739]|uniref:hypothetical protein n=1 Tax=Streptomyces sp. NPDC006739 TaxID=3364763 RepID=UPI0036A5171F
MRFHCAACNKSFTKTPDLGEVPFEVDGYEGLFLSGFKGREADGKMIIEAATCPECCLLAPRTCAAAPVPGESPGTPCADCGHAVLLHVGVDHCPVCEMLDLNRQLYRIVEGGPNKALQRAAFYAGGPYPHVLRR